MRDYNRDRRSYRRDSGRSEMHNAVCDECGKDCQVPFKPRGDKPVYCSECFEHKSEGSPRRSDRKDMGRQSFREKRIYRAVCDECGNDCDVPFRPSGDKPVYCDNCFKGPGRDNKGRSKDRDGEDLQKQIDLINTKLDKILQTMESFIVVEEKPKKKSSAKKTTSKKKKAKKPTKKTVKKNTKVRKSASKKK